MTATPQTSRALELLLKHDRPVPRYTSYPTAAAFRADVGDLQLRQQLAEITDAPLSLYVHVPFCRHACWYCGCNRITTQLGSKVVEPYLASLAQELELIAEAMPQRRRLALQQVGLQRQPPQQRAHLERRAGPAAPRRRRAHRLLRLLRRC